MRLKKCLELLEIWQRDIGVLSSVWPKEGMHVSKRRTQTLKTYTGLSQQFKENWTGPFRLAWIQAIPSIVDGDSFLLQKTKGINQPMRVDSIIRDVNLTRCCGAVGALGCIIALKNHQVSLMKMDVYFEEFGIKLEHRTKDNSTDKYFCLSQVSFFKLADFIGLLRLRTLNMQGYAIYPAWPWEDPVSTSYFCPFDVQPFRQHLFDSSHATLELFRVLSDLGYSDTDVKINNYDNVIEFNKNCIIQLVYVICDWIEEYEIELERYFNAQEGDLYGLSYRT